MITWVVLTVLTTAVALLLAAPLMRGAAAGSIGAGPVDARVYRDQLAELDRELADGLIDEAQAAAARLEIKRRVIALDRDSGVPVRRLSDIERKFFAGVVAGVIAIGGSVLYALNGSPDLPAVPRRAASGQQGVAAGQPGAVVPAVAATPGLSSVEEMIDRLAQRLDKTPDDADGWRMLGWSYFRTDRFEHAARAYARASALQPAVAPLKTAWAEALVRAADGKVSGEALRLFEEAVKLEPKDARARYFIGLSREQSGDAKAALDAWLALLAEATVADEWAPEVRQQAIGLAKSSGIDIASRLPPSPSGPGILGRLERGPTAADMQAAEALPPADREAMIRGMVDGLQSKLAANPRDADGWIRLFRARQVMGEPDQAQAALTRALAAFADTPAEHDRIAAAAREAGLVP